jgi:hypothetical protein
MAMAKVYASNPTLLINYLTKPVTIAIAIFFFILGMLGSVPFSNPRILGVFLHFGLSFYDAFIRHLQKLPKPFPCWFMTAFSSGSRQS